MTVLKKSFYLKDTLDVARELLGCVLCRRINDEILRGVIVETEAYTQDDPACHAYKGITERSKVMFEDGGISYVYFIYGMHFCFNAVTEKKNHGCAVLIRALEPLDKSLKTNGPSRLCKAFSITKDLNGVNITTNKSDIWIEKGFKPDNITSAKRIGIKEGADYMRRFYIEGNKWVSKK